MGLADRDNGDLAGVTGGAGELVGPPRQPLGLGPRPVDHQFLWVSRQPGPGIPRSLLFCRLLPGLPRLGPFLAAGGGVNREIWIELPVGSLGSLPIPRPLRLPPGPLFRTPIPPIPQRLRPLNPWAHCV